MNVENNSDILRTQGITIIASLTPVKWMKGVPMSISEFTDIAIHAITMLSDISPG